MVFGHFLSGTDFGKGAVQQGVEIDFQRFLPRVELLQVAQFESFKMNGVGKQDTKKADQKQ